MGTKGDVPSPAQIRQWTLAAIFSDDYFLGKMALKGGGALELAYKISARPSKDLDFSIEGEFEEEIDAIRTRFEKALSHFFKEYGLHLFDVTLVERPSKITDDLRDFWGGYLLNFKLIQVEKWVSLKNDIDSCRRQAIQIADSGSTKTDIDISRYECLRSLVNKDFEGYLVPVYSPEALVFEKLRALCQQMPEYGKVVKRDRPGSPRPRDFYDIETIRSHFTEMNLLDESAVELLKEFFLVKKVSLNLLQFLGGQECRDFHEKSWSQVRDTIPHQIRVESYDYYFSRTVDLVVQLCKILGIPDSPKL